MEILPRISSLYSEAWVGWVMFALFAIAMLGMIPQAAGATLQTIFSRAERTYSVRTRHWVSEITLRLFRVGVLALALLIWVLPQGGATLLSYAKVLGVLATIYTLQTLLMYAVGGVFLSAKRMDVALEQYSAIRTLLCIAMYPILLLLTNISLPALPKIAFGIIFGLYFVVLLAKSVQMFYTHILSVLYILLYIVCLEVLPIMVSLAVAERII